MEFKDIIELLENCEYRPRSYSGRAMYGKQCLGVVVKDSNVGGIICKIIEECIESSFDEPEKTLENVQELVHMFKRSQLDYMGLDYIVYWPDIKWEEIDEDDETNLDEE